MAMTNLRGDKATADEEEEPRDQSHAHVTIPDAVSSPWSAYDSSFMRGAQMDDSLQSSRGRSDWEGEGEGESYGFSRHAAFPVEMLEGFVAKIVSERTVKLQARISFLEDENKLIRSELESLKNLHLAAKKETSREDPLASAERQLTSQPPLLNGHVVDKSSDLMPVMHSEEKSQGEEFVGGCEENEDPKVGLQELAQEQKEQEQESSS
ncbi:hypothetical protein GUITHDRAFT_150013 [Guillardia theta CCMP2712]|uniref:Uncharacterized protein n=1 Tax=Guillardia theta (strain CCMP2712) TaxID=905079 RepID=L1K1F7_GUITC|nr:hypothetical protein GUITHDRAFT_150013 [Guillardia theta CCMP2712]EKX54437.1 hypothetical protein GUITHDRAFT_150013 [Guillardia theta CCMP2712]|eukprot:XP_005841417.1 hypothetical protein GUITHDRAFT_150013 [Guillardia theta CCMP2712]